MYYRIAEVSTAETSGLTYVLVEFWAVRADFNAARPAKLTEEFLMQLRVTGRRIVTNADGWYKMAGGTFVDPETLDPAEPQPEWERETFIRDVPAEIRANVEAYWKRTAEPQKLSGDHTSDVTKPLFKDGKLVFQRPTTVLVERDASDPHNILKRADVVALRGAKFDVVEAGVGA